MVMNARQVAATVVLALVIIGSVASMPRDVSKPMPPRQMGPLAAGPVIARELPAESVRDLTYN